MSVNDDAEHPWLTEEKRFMADEVRGDAVLRRVPRVQPLAASLGARVYEGPAPEVGLLPATLTQEGRSDPVFGQLPDEFLTLQWHGNTFELPDGAVALARSPAYPNQAFRWGERAYGVQFHLEVSTAMADDWAAVPAYAEALNRVLGPGSFEDLNRRLEQHEEEVRGHGRRLFERWLERVA